MKAEKKDIMVIKLSDNNEYVVISKAVYEKDTYAYIIDVINSTRFKIVKIEKNKLIEVPDDPKLIQKLIVLFYENIEKTLDLNELICYAENLRN
ncbi:MAG: hypothetical protein PHR96_03880 [Clostridia bacterium]|nr:hypothetical protein [Clostridia bacterium]